MQWGCIVVRFWDSSGKVLEHFGTGLGLFGNCFGTVLGESWNSLGMVSEQFWDSAGAVLEQLGDSFRELKRVEYSASIFSGGFARATGRLLHG